MNPWVRGPPARREGRREEGLCTRGARVTGPQRWAERGRPLHPGCAGHRPAERGGERKASAPWVRGSPARREGRREEGIGTPWVRGSPARREGRKEEGIGTPWVRGPPARREGRKEEGLCTLGARATGPQGGGGREEGLMRGRASSSPHPPPFAPAKKSGNVAQKVRPVIARHLPALSETGVSVTRSARR
jgi:hypothetical protein